MFFVSYEEEQADSNWQLIKYKFPHAKRIHGIKGIQHAHKACALKSFTKMFWTIDGDTQTIDGWDFSFIPPEWDKDYIHIWHSKNPINDLEYGYGGIKLWPTKKVLTYNENWLDFTTSVSDIKIIPISISSTMFNSSEYSTWKSSFRECVKLCTNIDMNNDDSESKYRLEVWCNKTNGNEFSDWCIKGANDAKKWYNQNKENLTVINDFDELKKLFNTLNVKLT